MLAALAALVMAETPLLAQMPPSTGHHEATLTGPIVETPEAMKVTTIIQCWCGGCVNQTLHECTCGLASTERQKVAAELAAGRTPETLIAAYVAEHGAQVRIVPERRGLNLIGWAVPFAAALGAILTLTLVLLTWKRRGMEPGPAAGTGNQASSPLERSYREALERDLRDLDG